MKKIITLALIILAVLSSSAFAYDVNIPHPQSWYYPGKYVGEFVSGPSYTSGGSNAVVNRYSGRYSTYGRNYNRGYYSRYSRYNSHYNMDRSYRYGYTPRYDRAKFLGYDRYGKKVYSIRY